jgi:hypothetical protein
MKKHFVLIVSLMLGLAAASALRISTHQGSSTGISNPSLDMNGAYRDGLFQGKQAAERHAPNMAPVGREVLIARPSPPVTKRATAL